MTTYPTVLDAPDVAEVAERVARADYEHARRRRRPGEPLCPSWDDQDPQAQAAAVVVVEAHVLATLNALSDMGFAVVPEAWTGLPLTYAEPPPGRAATPRDGADTPEALNIDAVTAAAEHVVKGAGQAAVNVAMASLDQVRSVSRKVTRRIHAA
ncbi:MAG: hypothetical protein V9G08_07865 [Dermatophilaceae bacterium]